MRTTVPSTTSPCLRLLTSLSGSSSSSAMVIDSCRSERRERAHRRRWLLPRAGPASARCRLGLVGRVPSIGSGARLVGAAAAGSGSGRLDRPPRRCGLRLRVEARRPGAALASASTAGSSAGVDATDARSDSRGPRSSARRDRLASAVGARRVLLRCPDASACSSVAGSSAAVTGVSVLRILGRARRPRSSLRSSVQYAPVELVRGNR